MMRFALVLVFLAGCQFELEPQCGNGLASRAIGSIRVPSAADLKDGETFILSDGINPSTVFEFNRTPSAPGHVRITFIQSQIPVEVRASTIDAINDIGTDLLITAEEIGGDGLFFLRHDLFTSRGNQPIAETVSSSSFTASSMNGGANGACPTDALCSIDDECASLICLSSSHRCR